MALSRINSQSIADGTVIASDIADGTVTNTKLAGSITSDKITSVSNTAISGLIQAAQIGSVSNTAISGLIQAAQIGSANASVIDAGTLAKARLPAGSVLQVVSDVNTGTFSTSSQTFVTTNQSLSITPSSASNKILVMFNAGSVTTLAQNTEIQVQVRRSGTVVCKGGYYTATVSGNQTIPFGVIQSLDSPNTTSSVTYEVFAQEGGLAGTVSLNNDRVLTLLEIAG